MSNDFEGLDMQLTLFTDYALRSLIFLAARPEELSSVKEIAEHYGISRNHLVKVIHKMATLGMIESTKGKGGGIKLAQDPCAMLIGDVVQKMESMAIVECFNRDTNTCRITEVCRLKHFLFEASRNFIETLNKYTVADAVANPALTSAMLDKS